MTLNTEQILDPLRGSGWISDQQEKKDFSVLFAALVKALNIRKDMRDLCAVFPYVDKEEGSRSIGLLDLLNAMAGLGHIAHPLKIDLKNLDPRLCPCLFLPNDHNGDEQDIFLVLDKSISDESEKNHILSIFRKDSENAEEYAFSNSLKGMAWIFVPEEEHTGSLTKSQMDAAGHSWFRALLDKFSSGLWPMVLIGAVLTILALAAPLFVMTVYDKVIGGHAPEALMPLLIGAILALSVEAGLRTVRSQSLSWYGARLDYIVSTHIFERLMKLPVMLTERASIAAQIARVRAFDAVRAFFTGPQILAVAELPFTILLVVVIALIAGPMAFVPAIVAIFYGLLFWLMLKPMRKAMNLSANSSSSIQEMLIETFEKIDALRVSGLTSIWFGEYRTRSGKAAINSFSAAWLNAVLETLSHALYIFAGLAVVVIGVTQIWSGGMTAGALIASMIITWRVLAPMQTLCNALPSFVQLQNAVSQINRLMTIEAEDSEEHVNARLDNPKGEIRFNKVGLRYTKDTDPVFTGLDFTAGPGTLTAITGGNGSGKSTVLKLINALYHPQAGSIHVDGLDIRQINPQHLRSHISYVPQIPNLFTGSIADNLRFANPLAQENELVEALEMVDLWEEVNGLPEGLSTVIGPQNKTFFPNEMTYNISLARAYIQNTPILLFDELPYAFLNGTAGRKFYQKIEEWKGRKTVLFVTHREDYLELSDQVVLLRAGVPPMIAEPDVVINAIYDQQYQEAVAS